MDIYPGLETEDPITAEHFDRSLERLYDKGILQREKVSPENLLVIATPVAALPIETSATNRKNPVYNYSLNVEKAQILAYLDSRLLTLEESLKKTPADSLQIRRQIKRVRSRLNILRQTQR